ncbi:hypothetical protein GCM10022416_54550 [Actinomadura keratinilytica]|uniref:Uncharacterized protein n=1 Tax=Actinomadura keratinilytica TaxID=547461 RepID=A0ABP7ZE05_9ACTN
MGEIQQQMLAVGVGVLEHLTIDQAGAVGETPLGAVGAHGPAAEPGAVFGGQAVNGVSFGHSGPSIGAR